MKKRIFILTLISLILLCSCGSDDSYAKDVYENVDPTYTQKTETAPPVDYGSYEFKILTAYAAEYENTSIFADETSGGSVNEETAKRNAAIEKNFNIILKEVSSIDPVTDIENSKLTGTTAYDMIVVPASDAALLISGGSLVDLADYSAFDKTDPAFDAGAVAELSVGGTLFALTGELITSSVPATSVVLCNNAVLRKIDFEAEFGKSLTALVRDGKWTLDVMIRAAALADAAGTDEKENVLFCGFREEKASVYSLARGALGKIFEKNDKDIPSLSVNGEGFAKIFKKISELDFENKAAPGGELIGSCYNMEIKPTEALFTVSTLGEALSLSQGGLCFTVLPMPKYDADQTDYLCRVDLGATELAAIPANTSDLARSASVLTALFAGSVPVREAYLSGFDNDCIHDAPDMIELVLSSRAYDLGDLFGWGEFEEALADAAVADEPETALAAATEARSLAADKAMDILLKRLLGEGYKEQQ